MGQSHKSILKIETIERSEAPEGTTVSIYISNGERIVANAQWNGMPGLELDENFQNIIGTLVNTYNELKVKK